MMMSKSSRYSLALLVCLMLAPGATMAGDVTQLHQSIKSLFDESRSSMGLHCLGPCGSGACDHGHQSLVGCDQGVSCDGQGCGLQCRRSRFKLTEFNLYPTFSYLDDKSGTYNEFEFASMTDLGFLEMENRTILNVADLPGTIRVGPQNPGAGLPGDENTRASGFGDILSGFFFSPRGAHEKPTHLGLGSVWTFPTASSELLGSEQYTVGPGAHFSTEGKRTTLGFFLWQSWGFAGSNGVKRVNQLNGKPFVIYELTERLHAVYIPLGLSHSWGAARGDDWTVPVGGGLRRLFEVHGQPMGFQMQAFDYVARKPKDPQWELRFTIEFMFD